MKKKWRVLALAVCLVTITLLLTRLILVERKDSSEELIEKIDAALEKAKETGELRNLSLEFFGIDQSR